MTKRVEALLPPLIVVLCVLPIYLLRLDRVVGMVVDDAWYVMLAKALAEGRGYQLINAPIDGILPGYPPGFPALLSLVFRLRPDFPGNVWLLKSVSVAAMLGVALLSYFYLCRVRQLPRHLAALASIGIATTPALVFLATSTAMSECVFMLAQLGVVVLAHRAIDTSPGRGFGFAVIAGVLAGATVLIRSVGVGVVAAVFLWLLRERQWKRASAFAIVVTICIGPWLLYSRFNTPTLEHRQVHRGSIVYSYGEQFWMRFAGSASSGRVTAADLPDRVATNVVDVVGRSAVGIFAPLVLRSADESGEEVVFLAGQLGWTFIGFGNLPATMALSFVFAMVVLWGFVRTVRERATVAEFLVPISLLITVLWPFWSFRFVLPLTPFVYFYFVQGLSISPRVPAARTVLLIVIGLNLFDHAGYIAQARSRPVDWVATYNEADTTLAWMKAHLEPGAVVAATNPALVHLLTGHKTITLDRVTEPWSVWRGRGARYAACLVAHELPSASRGPYRLLYQSTPDRPTSYWVIDLY
jgi:hypothetical protein